MVGLRELRESYGGGKALAFKARHLLVVAFVTAYHLGLQKQRRDSVLVISTSALE